MTATIDKLALFRDIGYSPHPGQLAVHASSHKRRVVACGVRWGKTLAAAHEGIAASINKYRWERVVGWVCAPTYELAGKVYREVAGAFMSNKILRGMVIRMRESDRMLEVHRMDGGVCEIRAKSADSPTSLLGEGLSWLIVDEASRVKPDVWQRYLSQRLIDRDGWAMLISTPKGKNWYWDMFRSSATASWSSPSWENPILDREKIEAEREKIPEAVFRQEYGAEFIEGAGAVFRNVRELATGELTGAVKNRRYVAGLDLAKVQDYTVLVVIDVDEKRVVHVDRFHRIDWKMQVERVAAACAMFGDPFVMVDSTGKGEPVYEALLDAGIQADGYQFTQASKAALVNNLALMLERRELTLPNPMQAPELIDELEAFEYTITDAGNVRSGAPPGQHDDCVIALALAAWDLRGGGGTFEAQVVG